MYIAKKGRLIKVCCLILALTLIMSLTACGKKPDGEKATDLSGLKGKVVYNVGKGMVPDLTFKYILKEAGIPYEMGETAKDGVVRLAYANGGDAIIPLLESGKAEYAIAPEPSATKALTLVNGSKIMLDIQSLYSEYNKGESGYPQGCLIVKKSFLQANERYVYDFCEALKAGTDWAEKNVESAISSLTAVGSKALSALTSDAAKRSNVAYENATTAKTRIENYFNAISGVTIGDEPSPIGGKLPDSEFYKQATQAAVKDNVTAKVFCPDGSPALAMAKLVNDNFAGATFSVVPPNLIDTKVIQEADIAIMPINSAANLYNKGEQICILAIVTTGGNYMLTKA